MTDEIKQTERQPTFSELLTEWAREEPDICQVKEGGFGVFIRASFVRLPFRLEDASIEYFHYLYCSNWIESAIRVQCKKQGWYWTVQSANTEHRPSAHCARVTNPQVMPSVVASHRESAGALLMAYLETLRIWKARKEEPASKS